MAEKQGRDSFQEKSASRTYNVLTLLLVLLVFGAAGLHYMINVKQKTLTQTAASAQAQSMLTQRIALLVALYQSTGEGRQMEDLKSTASAAIVNHDTVEPELLSVLPSELSDGSSVQDAMATVRGFVSKTMSYAASPHAEGTKGTAQAIITQSRDVASLWDALTTDFIAAAQKQIDNLMKVSLGVCALILGLLVYQAVALVNPAMACITRQRSDLDRVAALDSLSGIYNRAMLFKVAGMLISTYKRQKQPLTALAIDIDFLKKINDTHGRAAGDAVIKKVAATLSETMRTSDVIGRVGGGEFCVFLPSIDDRRASLVAEKLRAAIEAMPFSVKYSMVLVCVSIGVAEMTEYHKTPDDILRAAEESMRRAKENGRNMVFSFAAVNEALAKGAVAAAAAQDTPV